MQHSTFKRVQKIALKFTEFQQYGSMTQVLKSIINKPFYIFSIKIKEYRDTAVIHVNNIRLLNSRILGFL